MMRMRKDVRALSEPTMNKFYTATNRQHTQTREGGNGGTVCGSS